ncbi:MAG: hypothetical protein Q8930_05240 [Bacillota bacterium]|nr:hypothetical protein [Bacillota bacterium]
MYEAINKELLEVKEHNRKRERIQLKVKNAEIHLEEEKRRLEELEALLEKEELDVKKLEGLSLKGLFLTVLGSKIERLSIEKQEALSAKLKYDDCGNSIRLIMEEIEGYNSELRKLGYAKSSYEELLRKKEELIKHSNDRYLAEIAAINEEIADLRLDLKELNEAIQAGSSVQQSLENAADALKSAENWGTWDMLGGGLLSTAAKHSKIDEASDHIMQAKGFFNRFRRELADVHMTVDTEIDITSFDRFADYFFDGLIADWNVQSKIHRAQDSVYTALNEITAVIENLVSSSRDVEGKIEYLRNKIKSIIETAI